MAYSVLFNSLFKRSEPVDPAEDTVAQPKTSSGVGEPIICTLPRVIDHLSTDHFLDHIFAVQHPADLDVDDGGSCRNHKKNPMAVFPDKYLLCISEFDTT